MNQSFEDAAQRMIAACRKRNSERADYAATQPQAIKCGIHGIECAIDLERTRVDAAAYDPCPECVAEVEAERNRERLMALGVPRRLAGATMDQLRYDDAADRANLARCQEWADEPAGFIVLLGECGTGKSHIAASIIGRHRRGRFVTQAQILRTLRASYADPRTEDIVEVCSTVKLLALDEIGVSGGGKDEAPALHQIISARYENFLPTIMTSNLDGDAFKAAMGDRLTDRIREASGGVLRFCGRSKRHTVNARYLETARQRSRQLFNQAR